MKKICYAKPFKVLCFLLSLLFFVLAAFNVMITVIAAEENLLYVDENALANKAFSYCAEFTANKANTYFDYITRLQNGFDNDYYYQNEAEIMKSYFSRDNCNVEFQIKDENNKVVLSNFTLENPAFTYSRNVYQTLDSGHSKKTAEEYTTFISESTDPTTPDTETEAIMPSQKNSETVSDTQSASFSDYETTCTDIDNLDEVAVTEPPSQDEYKTIINDDRIVSDTQYVFCYHYPAGQENYQIQIFNYCYSLFENGLFFDSVEYGMLDENGTVHYNETDYDIGEDSLVYYKWKTEQELKTVKCTVTVFVPSTENLVVKDIYYYTAKLVHFMYHYKQSVIPTTVLFTVLAFAFYICLLVFAGHTNQSNTIVAKGFHRIPLDLLLLVFAGIGIALIPLTDEISSMGSSGWFSNALAFAFFGISLSFLLSVVIWTFTVRVKAKTVFRNLFLVILFVWIKKALGWVLKGIKKLTGFLSANIPTMVKMIIGFAVFAVVGFIGIAIASESEGVALVLFTLLLFSLLPFLLLFIYEVITVQKGAERIAKGDYCHKISEHLLFGEFKTHARLLNSLADGLQGAVSEQLKSERMKTELITNVSHDLKTPLTSIVSYVDLLKKRNLTDEKAQEYIDILERQASRLKKLTFDVVEASKAATGNLTVNQAVTPLNLMLKQVFGEYEERLQKKGLLPVIQMPDKELYAEIDGDLLWRITDNLLGNIVKFSQPDTRVYLSLSEIGGFAVMGFKNISATQLNITPEELTERFVRGDASRNTEGSGLGLSIAKSLTELMHGEMKIEIDGDLFKVGVRFPIASVPNKKTE